MIDMTKLGGSAMPSLRAVVQELSDTNTNGAVMERDEDMVDRELLAAFSALAVRVEGSISELNARVHNLEKEGAYLRDEIRKMADCMSGLRTSMGLLQNSISLINFKIAASATIAAFVASTAVHYLMSKVG